MLQKENSSFKALKTLSPSQVAEEHLQEREVEKDSLY